MRHLRIEPTWDAFRDASRGLLKDRVHPRDVIWDDEEGAQPQLPLLAEDAVPHTLSTTSARVPRRYLELGELVACHRGPSAWGTLYRVLWRIATGERSLLSDAADEDVAGLHAMERAVRRDAHKMKAFVRFRMQPAEGDTPRFVAWFEPKHRIVRHTAPFFMRRFPSMVWSILTPDECAHWDGEVLSFGPGASRSAAAGSDPLEESWLTYYAHTFNPARVRVQAMRAEMPVYYWRNMPEAVSIPELLRAAPARVRTMIQLAGEPPPARPKQPRTPSRPSNSAVEEAIPPGSPIRIPGFRIGVAGWDYPDWGGRVYPSGRTGVDRLRWVAARFDLIEVNATFYRPASPRVTNSWLERTRQFPELRFAAKLTRVFTHGEEKWHPADEDAVEQGMLPLLQAGRLSSLLVQFPWSFRNRPGERERLQRILDRFSIFPLQVEVRHDSWDDDEFRDSLAQRGIGFVNIDQPIFSGSLAPTAHATSRLAYLRLHGRNSEAWFREDATRDERYDYRYAPAELDPWVERARSLAAREDVDEVDVVFNNHYRAQAVDNADMFAQALLRGGLAGQAHPALLR